MITVIKITASNASTDTKAVTFFDDHSVSA